MPSPSKNIPTILVVLGATGDLMARKITPALFHLFDKNELPNHFQVIGFARRNLSPVQFRNHIKTALLKHTGTKLKQEKINSFLELFTYHRGQLQSRTAYKKLAKTLDSIDESWGVCSNKLFYLAVPPELYKTILNHLAGSHLTDPCSPEEGWTRIIVEKPFGKDYKSAQELDRLLGQLFEEIQIYRIDHYLAKEMLQNILSFRFSNNLFEEIWSRNFIERIDIKLLESIGVEERGNFYDGLGALRDVGQNHLLQMLALITMEHPENFEAEPIRTKREEILKALRPLSKSEIKTQSFRAQYRGYRQIKGVNPKSQTETYFKIQGRFLSTPRWQGVPVGLESGKRLAKARKDITVTLKHLIPCLCPPGAEHYKNKVVFSIEPKEGIVVQFWSKKPGLQFKIEERDFQFLLRKTVEKRQYTEEYKKLLLDCIAGDQTLFLSTGEVKAMWRFTDPITRAWEENLVPLETYKPNADDILSRADLAEIKRTFPFGIIGLGKMGGNIARRLAGKGWQVVAFNRTPTVTEKLAEESANILAALSIKELVKRLPKPRVVWLMVPAGRAVDEIIAKLTPLLSGGDTIIDGGNSFYKDSIRRHKKLSAQGINFIDVGVSGGPKGALTGPSLMIGGEKRIFKKLERLFADMAKDNSYQFFEGAGAGHFVKMIHNGIEYGMMQALAEGFTVLKKSSYNLNLKRVADIYNHGSVIESRLVGWLKDALEIHGENLKAVTGKVGHTGEGSWTVKAAKEMRIKTKIIEESLKFRKMSEKQPSYTGKILSALRERFGGHPVAKNLESRK